MTFNFSESKSEIRNVIVNGEPHFVGSDIAKALGYDQPHKAIQRHCRYGTKHTIPHPQSKTKQLQVLVIPEGDVYRLITNSTLPSAQKFERWVMDEVLPSIRKKGFYGVSKKSKDFIDARDIPYTQVLFNETPVRTITTKYFRTKAEITNFANNFRTLHPLNWFVRTTLECDHRVNERRKAIVLISDEKVVQRIIVCNTCKKANDQPQNL